MAGVVDANMPLALEYVAMGILRVYPNGAIWRVGERRGTAVKPCTPRRAESPGDKGYLRVVIGAPEGRGTRAVYAHRLVYRVLVGEIPDGMQVNHKDLDKSNNHSDNLELVTGQGNIAHSYAHGRPRPWSRRGRDGGYWRPGRPLLTDEQKEAVRALRANGDILRVIAQKTGISLTHVHRIIREGDRHA